MDREAHAAFLEQVRRSGIRMDRQGRFWHEGEEVLHQGLRQALFRWLDWLPPPEGGPNGRHILRLDAERFAYLEVEDTPLVATSMRWEGDRALLGLQDGSEEPLDPATLTVDGQGILRCRVHHGRPEARLEARLDTAAAATLAERIEPAAGGAERPVLRSGNRRLPIASR